MSTHSLRWNLSGRFEHPHWLAHVSGGLADLGISVVTGHAVRRVAGSWEAYLVVDVSGSVVPASDVDVAALAAAPPGPQRAVPLRLSAAGVRRRPDGFLEVEVSAVDELGFLGRLLRRVALLGLHPVEVTVATRNGVVHDRLVLAGIGSKVPSEEIAALVEQVLDGLVVR